MKKICVMIVCLLFLFSCMSLSECADSTFDRAKLCIEKIGKGDLEGAANAVGLSEKELREAVNTLAAYPQKVQSAYAVSWEENGLLFLAVPLQEPADGFIDTAVFSLSADESFQMLSFEKWSDVQRRCQRAESMRWNAAYSPSFIVLSD